MSYLPAVQKAWEELAEDEAEEMVRVAEKAEVQREGANLPEDGHPCQDHPGFLPLAQDLA